MGRRFEEFGLGPQDDLEFGFPDEGLFYLPVKRFPVSGQAERYMADHYASEGATRAWRAVSEVYLAPDEPNAEAYWVESDRDADYAIGVWRLVNIAQQFYGPENQEPNPHWRGDGQGQG